MPLSLVRFFIASVLLTLLVPPAYAAERPRVQVLPTTVALAPLRALVEAELRAAGLDVVEDDPVDAVVRLTNAPRSVTIWTARDLRLRSYASDPRATEGADDALARQVAEVLRAELTLSPEPPAPTSPTSIPAEVAPSLPEPQVDALPAPEAPKPFTPAPLSGTEPPLPPPWAELVVAPTAALSPGPLPTMGMLSVEARTHPFSALEVSLFTAWPMATVTAEDARGDLVATTGHLGAHLGWDLLPGAHWSLVPQVGASWQWIQLVGRAVPPFRSARASGHLGWLFGGASLGYAATSWLTVVVGGRVGVALPRVDLTIADASIGGYAWPAVHVYGGLALPLRGSPW